MPPTAPALAVVGGRDVSQAELNRLGIVGLFSSDESVCTGTRIGDGLILTAKHCACGSNGDLRNVIFNTDFFNADGLIKRPVVDVATTTDELGSDLALVRYAGATPADHGVANLNLAPLDPDADDAAQLFVYGFGRQVDGSALAAAAAGDDGDGTGKLRRIENRILGLREGEATLTARPVRTWEGQCFGDSGGPAFLMRSGSQGGVLSQVGVLSHGLIDRSAGGYCADGGQVEKYVDIAAHAEWIEEAAAAFALGGGPRVLPRRPKALAMLGAPPRRTPVYSV